MLLEDIRQEHLEDEHYRLVAEYDKIDISEKYCELARKRLDMFTKQTTIFDIL